MNLFTRTFSKIFKSSNQQELDKIKNIILAINSKENEIKSLSEGEIKEKSVIYTSGTANLFKAGIPVGKISKHSNNKVIFFSDFDQLDYVKIVSLNIEGNN